MNDFITPTELAKLTGQRPQAIYNLARQGYIKTEVQEVLVKKTVISKKIAEEYIAKRAANSEKRAAKIQSELNKK
jgi:hypothetical protein